MSHSFFLPQLKRLLQYAVNLILYRYEVDLPSSSALLRRSGAIELSWYSWRCGSAKFQSILLHRRVKTVLGGYGSIDGDSESLWSEGRPRLSEIKCMSNLSNRSMPTWNRQLLDPRRPVSDKKAAAAKQPGADLSGCVQLQQTLRYY